MTVFISSSSFADGPACLDIFSRKDIAVFNMLTPPGTVLELSSYRARDKVLASKYNEPPVPWLHYRDLNELPPIPVEINLGRQVTLEGKAIETGHGKVMMGRRTDNQDFVLVIPYRNFMRGVIANHGWLQKSGVKIYDYFSGGNSAKAAIDGYQKILSIEALRLANKAVELNELGIFPRLLGVSRAANGNFYLVFEMISGNYISKYSLKDLQAMEPVYEHLDMIDHTGFMNVKYFLQLPEASRQRIIEGTLRSPTEMSIFKTSDERLLLFNTSFNLQQTPALVHVIPANAAYGSFSFQRARALLNTPNVSEGLQYLKWLKQNDISGAWHGVLGALELLNLNGIKVPQIYLDMASER